MGGVCWGVSAPGGVCSRGGLLWGVLLPGGPAPGGVSGIPTCTEADPPPWAESQTPVKNITLATSSLRPVKSMGR